MGDCIFAKNRPRSDGYVQVRVDGRKRYAHVAAWEAEHGPKPEGMTVDHLCFVRNCINLDHLELVTHQENCARRRSRTHCFRGHEFTLENTRNKKNQRLCRICARESQRARRAA